MSVSVSAAVAGRISVRAFLPKPVPRELVEELLETARRAPSGGNVQPWRLHVLGGATLDEFRALIRARREAGAQEAPQYQVYPPHLWEPHRSYRFKNGEDLYASIGVAREDKPARLAQFARNFAFFDAPVALFFSLDRRFGLAQWADMGMLMQTIMLLAVERGLGTCPQACWAAWPETVAEFLELDEGQILLGGMALGYPDEAAPVNALCTDRAELADFCTIRGF
ncbi:nitroreductase [Acidocella sp. KAb 2-4]|uniref:nitroreductase n=1 Tax=Acidocella sp. KAb 2-4 TaxID=2885158 RepID=UPI001D083077|nr:nitroreductase [Acidocella sp. KAb 2-4]